MARWERTDRPVVLLSQLRWFTRLRWGAGAAVLLGALADGSWLGWYRQTVGMLIVGGAILAYNVLLRAAMGRAARATRRSRVMMILAGAQILLDLSCLSLLVVWTGGPRSPLLGFFVFHMVFASLLLFRWMAFAGAGVAFGMMAGAMAVAGELPTGRGDMLLLCGWGVMLLLTVYLANHITVSLRRHRQRLLEKNIRIRAMSRQLRQQRRTIEHQDKMAAMGQMAAGVAHEIANPLACMDSMLQLLQRHPERGQKEDMGRLRQQIGRINQIVQQLTRFAHPVEGQWQWVPVNLVVERALEMVRFDPRIRQIAVGWHKSPPDAAVRAQPTAIEQVLVNLIINALDAMDGLEEPRLEIRTDVQEDGCTIEIADTGHGILANHVNHIFEPFFTTKPVGKGTGLGLSISYTLIRNHGGSISVQSQVGQGTRFTVRLPTAARLSQAGTAAVAHYDL